MSETLFQPKYNMSLNDNVLWAKRNMIDSIWKSANLEGSHIPIHRLYVRECLSQAIP